jgi:carbamoyl-phosphate synthase large subunit
VASKIAVGKRLDEIPNAVTGKTMAAFEPALDYIVVKIPRWPFDKFASGDRLLGTQMKATGEVMAIDRTFEAALQKAVRSLEFGKKTLLWEDRKWILGPDINTYPLEPTDLRLWAVMAALRRGISHAAIHQKTNIDMWFLDKMVNIVNMEKQLLSQPLTPDFLRAAKKLGFSDEMIGTLADRLPEQVREMRQEWKIRPVYKMVDTCAAEFDAATPYFYSTYESENEAIAADKKKAVVIGSGPIRIGQGIEFDYCSVHAAMALKEAGYQSIMINSNPETVSTDFDTSDRLYFESLDEESIRDILDNENSNNGEDAANTPSIVQFGGQTAINLADPLARAGMPVLGTSAECIDLSEDRRRFEQFLGNLGIPQPPGAGVTSIEEALKVAKLIGYPVLVRPSYVLGGRGMEIVHNASELSHYMSIATELNTGHPVLIDKYLEGKEAEVDCICDGETVLIPGLMEQLERAGVHSGDSMAVYPGLTLTTAEIDTITDYAVRIGLALNVKGLMNIQFVIMPDHPLGGAAVYVLEVNSRASRTVPFISKVTGVPMVKVAVKVMLGTSLKQQGYETGIYKRQHLVAIKAPVFSMSKLIGVDTHLGPEMKSTGEVMGIDYRFEAALAKTLLAAGLMLPKEGGILLSVSDRDKPEAVPIIKKLAGIGYKLYATEGTAAMLSAMGLPVTMTTKKLSEGHPNVLDVIIGGNVQGVINTVTSSGTVMRDGFAIRRTAAERRIPCFTSLDTARAAVDILVRDKHDYHVQPLASYRNRREP